MLTKIFNKGNSHLLPVGAQIYTATMEISVTVPKDPGNRSISRSSSTILGQILKGLYTLLQGHWLNTYSLYS